MKKPKWKKVQVVGGWIDQKDIRKPFFWEPDWQNILYLGTSMLKVRGLKSDYKKWPPKKVKITVEILE